jgi:SOS-response transcriptional repressor LexA
MKTVEIPVLNPVNGGTPVPGDWKAFAAATVREVSEIKDPPPFSKHVAIPVDGNSLKSMGIHHGDILICRKTRLYTHGAIGIWETPHGRTAKYAYLNKDGSVTLHNHNGWQKQYSADEVTLFAVAIRVERDLV